eukprot:CAMPEP_0184342678 /NCGR_PEP_ID=MMETSP1089-20130417/11263_1 /TAXON_ID=38269 ORGANISM="Gloeochaete wittrockiana, Strain SAG46.84" /NCGR_SAMPLE_ID=MMETSP1089 /ASSEMBLY_ACC=CAM_ASM_000445 /LENGTH=516 /DNA_ID=CAMNT_0026671645 /DNA_START=1 /DNA_END=1547 /DNA_ORIENTATION=-
MDDEYDEVVEQFEAEEKGQKKDKKEVTEAEEKREAIQGKNTQVLAGGAVAVILRENESLCVYGRGTVVQVVGDDVRQNLRVQVMGSLVPVEGRSDLLGGLPFSAGLQAAALTFSTVLSSSAVFGESVSQDGAVEGLEKQTKRQKVVSVFDQVSSLLTSKKLSSSSSPFAVLLFRPLQEQAQGNKKRKAQDAFALKEHLNTGSLSQGRLHPTKSKFAKGEDVPFVLLDGSRSPHRIETRGKWAKRMLTISSSLSHGSSRSLLVCGASSVGKSTFVRSLSNALISSKTEVALMDLDVCQTEHNAPGMIAVHIIGEKELSTGTPFGTIRQPLMSRFCGFFTPIENSTRYLSAVADLYQAFRKWQIENDHRDIPLIINTNSEVQATGTLILSKILGIVQPSLSLLIRSPDSFQISTPSLFQDHQHLLDSHLQLSVNPATTVMRLSKKAKRDEMLARYFLGETEESLTKQSVFVVDWGKILVRVEKSDLDPKLSLLALNGSIVGLCDAHEVASNYLSTSSS